MKRLLPLTLAAVVGCLHGRGQEVARVSDADAGRLSPEQVGPVNRARQELDAAKDAHSRAVLGVEQARNEEVIAKAELQAAEADQKVADAQRKVADDSRAPEAVERAQQLRARAIASGRSAALHLEYARKLVEEREAGLKAAERQVELSERRVELAKLQALEQAGIPAATKYEARRFQEAVSEAQGALEEATRDARSRGAEATAVRQRWDALRQQQGDAGQTGTGSGQ